MRHAIKDSSPYLFLKWLARQSLVTSLMVRRLEADMLTTRLERLLRGGASGYADTTHNGKPLFERIPRKAWDEALQKRFGTKTQVVWKPNPQTILAYLEGINEQRPKSTREGTVNCRDDGA